MSCKDQATQAFTVAVYASQFTVIVVVAVSPRFWFCMNDDVIVCFLFYS